VLSNDAFLDRLHLLQSRMLSMGGLLNWVLNALQDLGGFVITAALLATVYPPLLLLIPVGLLALWLQSVSQRIASRAQEASAPGYRLAMQLRELATSASAGKEIRVLARYVPGPVPAQGSAAIRRRTAPAGSFLR
jgi:hypothetical protein